MVIIISDDNLSKRYKIVPLDNGLCYQIFVSQKVGTKNRSGKEIKNEWRFTGKYGWDIPHSIDIVTELILKDPDDQGVIEVKSLKSATKTISKHIDELKSKIKGEVVNNE